MSTGQSTSKAAPIHLHVWNQTLGRYRIECGVDIPRNNRRQAKNPTVTAIRGEVTCKRCLRAMGANMRTGGLQR